MKHIRGTRTRGIASNTRFYYLYGKIRWAAILRTGNMRAVFWLGISPVRSTVEGSGTPGESVLEGLGLAGLFRSR